MYTRNTGAVLALEECSITLEHRFCFYDQIHTTGMDIKHHQAARAALTLGKDMTWRDYAQGAYRMRGIGKGQTIELLVTPEAKRLIVADMRKIDNELLEAHPLDGAPFGTLPDTYSKRVAAWLQLQQMRSEKMQFKMLQLQNLADVWRKPAFRFLAGDVGDDYGHYSRAMGRDEEVLVDTLRALATFKESLGDRTFLGLPHGGRTFHVRLWPSMTFH